jgi:DNA end-binding protein Ku
VRAMEESGLSAIARYVFHDRQQLGCLRIREGVITLESMYFADEIRPVDGITPKRQRVDKRELEMAETLIDRFTSTFDHGKYRDEYTEKLLEIVKRKGEDVHAATPEEREEAPSDLLEALRASVESARVKSASKSASKSTSKSGPKSKSSNGRSKAKSSGRRKTRARARS